MPVPTNTDPTTALDLGAMPVALAEDVTLAPGFNVPREVWFTYTHQTDDVVIALAPLATLASGYRPIARLYNTLAAALADTPFYLNFNQSENVPLQVPVQKGITYYLRVGDASFPPSATAPLMITGALPPALGAPIGSFFINDDTAGNDASAGYPLVVLSSVDGAVVQIRNAAGRNDWPAGEGAAMLPDGTSLWVDLLNAPGVLQLFGPPPTMAALATVTVSPGSGVGVVTSNRQDTFYVGYPGGGVLGNSKVYRVSKTGAVTMTWTLATPHLWFMGVSPDESILYYADRNLSSNDPGEPIKRWDLVNNVALADFAAGNDSYFFTRDLLVLADGTLLVGYVKNTGSILRHYAVNGSTILDVTNPAYVRGAGDRACYALLDDTTYWIFTNANHVTQFYNVRVSDGVVVAGPFGPPQFEVGIYAGNPGDVLGQDVGTSNSCPIVLQRGAALAPFPAPAPPAPPGCGPTTNPAIGCANDLPVSPSTEGPGCATDVPTSPLRMQEAA